MQAVSESQVQSQHRQAGSRVIYLLPSLLSLPRAYPARYIRLPATNIVQPSCSSGWHFSHASFLSHSWCISPLYRKVLSPSDLSLNILCNFWITQIFLGWRWLSHRHIDRVLAHFLLLHKLRRCCSWLSVLIAIRVLVYLLLLSIKVMLMPVLSHSLLLLL